MLDDGRLTNNKGRVVNFKNTIIIMTSDIGHAWRQTGSHYLSRAREALRSDGGIIQENFEKLERKDVDAVVEKTQREVMDPAMREPCAPSSGKPSPYWPRKRASGISRPGKARGPRIAGAIQVTSNAAWA